MTDTVLSRTPYLFAAAGISRGQVARLVLRCIMLLLAANALFLTVRLADNLVPKRTVAAALGAGFADGGMTEASYPTNMFVGRDQYSDCIAAQLALLGGQDVLTTAVAPRLLSPEQVGADLTPVRQYPCRALKRFLNGGDRAAPTATYTRFWQGSASVLAFALTVLPVDAYRALLLATALALIAATGVLAALDSRRLLLAMAPLLLAATLFSGQIGYGQLFSHGPPQIALWLFVATMVALRRHMSHDRLILIAVAAGATEAFLDQIISVPMVAGIFLIVAGLVSHGRDGTPDVRRAAIGMATIACAWLFGFAGTYAMKLVLSVALLGWGPAQDFLQQLAFRAGTVDPEFGYTAARPPSRFVLLWPNILALAGNFWRLGFAGDDSGILNYVALMAGAGGWVAAIRRRGAGPAEDRARALAAGMPYIAAALFLLLWVLAFPEHTMRHAFFMVRSAILWLIGGWGWLLAAYPPGQRTSAGHASDTND